MATGSQNRQNRRRVRDATPENDEYAVIVLNEVSNEASAYGEIHTRLMRFMLSAGVSTVKRFYLTFIKAYATMMGRHVSVVAKMKATESELLSLTDEIINCCNKRINKLGFRLKRSHDEFTEEDVVVAVSDRPFSEHLSTIAGFTQDDRVLLTRFLTEMVNNDGCMERNWALQQTRSLPNPMSHLKGQALLDRLVEEHWFSERDAEYGLQPRAVAELDALLRSKYKSKQCSLCSKTVLRLSIAVSCDACDIITHPFCWKRYVTALNIDPKNCEKCRAPLSSGGHRDAAVSGDETEIMSESDNDTPVEQTRKRQMAAAVTLSGDSDSDSDEDDISRPVKNMKIMSQSAERERVAVQRKSVSQPNRRVEISSDEEDDDTMDL